MVCYREKSITLKVSASEAMEADTRSEEEMEKIEEKEEDKRRKLENIIGDVLVFYRTSL